MVTQAQLENYTEGINKISLRGREAAKARFARLDYSDMTKAIDEMVKIMEGVCATSADAAGELGAVFYAGQSMMQTGEGFNAFGYPEHRAVATEKAVRGIVQLGVDGDFESMFDQLLGRVDYEVKKAAGYTVMRNAQRDSRRPRFARVLQGAHSCDFCVMLSSRGPVYHTAESAGFLNHYHMNCDCRIVPVWGAEMVMTKAGGWIARGFTPIEGYDPDALFADYLQMMLNPKVVARFARAAERARARQNGKTPSATTRSTSSPTSWARAYRDGLVTMQSVGEVENYLLSATDYDDLAARLKKVNEELPYYYLSERYIADLQRAALKRRDQLLAS